MTRSTAHRINSPAVTALALAYWRLKVDTVVDHSTSQSTSGGQNGHLQRRRRDNHIVFNVEPASTGGGVDIEIARMVREQAEAKALLDSGHPDQRGARQWHDDALLEEVLIRTEER